MAVEYVILDPTTLEPTKSGSGVRYRKTTSASGTTVSLEAVNDYYVKVAVDTPYIKADDAQVATITAHVFTYLDVPATDISEVSINVNGTVKTAPCANGSATYAFKTAVAGDYAIVVSAGANARPASAVIHAT